MCWRCPECGYKNCDTDDCQNIKCSLYKKELKRRMAGLTQTTTMEKQIILEEFRGSK